MNSSSMVDIYKIIMTGDSGVGKTSLFSTYITNQSPEQTIPTVGAQFATKTVTLRDGSEVRAQIFDTAGQEKYKSLIAGKALGCLLVFDVTSRDSFTGCTGFLELVRQIAEPDCVIFLVGNKIDLVSSNEKSRQVTQEEAKQYALENKLTYIETSAKAKFRVTDAFENLLEMIHQEAKKTVSYSSKPDYVDISRRKHSPAQSAPKSGCCDY